MSVEVGVFTTGATVQVYPLALRGPTETVMSVAFSPDGRSIAAGSWAREVFIWEALAELGAR